METCSQKKRYGVDFDEQDPDKLEQDLNEPLASRRIRPWPTPSFFFVCLQGWRGCLRSSFCGLPHTHFSPTGFFHLVHTSQSGHLDGPTAKMGGRGQQQAQSKRPGPRNDGPEGFWRWEREMWARRGQQVAKTWAARTLIKSQKSKR